jgi:RNA polymerase sigma-70 factor (ECF subfamily)
MKSDNELIKDYQNGDVEAFNELVRKHLNMTYNYFLSITQDRVESDDLSQKVFLNLINGLKNFRFQSSFNTYLYRVKINVLNSYFFKNKWNSFLHLDQIKEPSIDDSTHEKAFLSKELWENIEILPKKQRNVIVLRIANQLSYKEISEVLSISEDAAKNNYVHGVKNLKKRMNHG